MGRKQWVNTTKKPRGKEDKREPINPGHGSTIKPLRGKKPIKLDLEPPALNGHPRLID
jgi:hypothetical protein